MSVAILAALTIFTIAYAAITLEHTIHVPKQYTALFLALVLWTLGSISGAIAHPMEEFNHHGVDVLGIVFFLWFAMALVEVLVHLGFFDMVAWVLEKLPIGTKTLAFVFWIVAFFTSAALDNLTTALVMARISLLLFNSHRNRVAVIAGIIIAANTGGAWSPIGDVTTVMLWIAGKFTTQQIITTVFLPSLVNMLTASVLLLLFGFEKEERVKKGKKLHITRGAPFFIPLTLSCFGLPLVVSQIHLPPALGLAGGLGIVASLIHLTGVKLFSHEDTPLEMSLSDIMRKVDQDSLFFFFGILFAVGALESMGILDSASVALLGSNPSMGRIEGVNGVIGIASAVFDNIPLVAAAMKIITSGDYRIWTQLAYTAGTGGSILIIGSAAGIATMSVYKGMNSGEYFRRASFPALAGYIAGYVTMLLMF